MACGESQHADQFAEGVLEQLFLRTSERLTRVGKEFFWNWSKHRSGVFFPIGRLR